MTLKNAVRRTPLPGKRKVFPTEKESLKGRYAKLTAADRLRLIIWAGLAQTEDKSQPVIGVRPTRRNYSERYVHINMRKRRAQRVDAPAYAKALPRSV